MKQDGQEKVSHEETTDADDDQVVGPHEAEVMSHQHVNARGVRVERGALHDHKARGADVVERHRAVAQVGVKIRASCAVRDGGARVRTVHGAELSAVLQSPTEGAAVVEAALEERNAGLKCRGAAWVPGIAAAAVLFGSNARRTIPNTRRMKEQSIATWDSLGMDDSTQLTWRQRR